METWLKKNKKLAVVLFVIILVVASALDLVYKGLLYKTLTFLL